MDAGPLYFFTLVVVDRCTWGILVPNSDFWSGVSESFFDAGGVVDGRASGGRGAFE